MKSNIFSLDEYQRITSGGRVIPEVDGLRFVAISTVVVFHILNIFLARKHNLPLSEVEHQNILLQMITHGNFGVQIFFVISGFILSLPFAKQHMHLSPRRSLKEYFLRRVTRLEPPYVLNMLLAYLAITFLTGSSLHLIPSLAAGLCYQHGLIFGQMNMISPITWSLEIEVQFYILAPLFALCFKIPNQYVRQLVFVCYIAISAYAASFMPEGTRLGLSLAAYSQYFIAGFLLSDIYLSYWKGKPRKRLAGDLFCVAGILLLMLHFMGKIELAAVLPIGTLLFFIGVFTGKVFNYILTRKIVTVIGGMCYTIYLYHFLLIMLATELIFKNVPAIWEPGTNILDGFYSYLIGNTTIILVISAVMFRLFERPFMRAYWYRRSEREVAVLETA